MQKMKRNVALLAAAAVAGTIGLGGVVAAQASAPNGTGDTASVSKSSTSDGEQADGTESESDGPDQGPDANPNEPGHQDADDGTAD